MLCVLDLFIVEMIWLQGSILILTSLYGNIKWLKKRSVSISEFCDQMERTILIMEWIKMEMICIWKPCGNISRQPKLYDDSRFDGAVYQSTAFFWRSTSNCKVKENYLCARRYYAGNVIRCLWTRVDNRSLGLDIGKSIKDIP